MWGMAKQKNHERKGSLPVIHALRGSFPTIPGLHDTKAACLSHRYILYSAHKTPRTQSIH